MSPSAMRESARKRAMRSCTRASTSTSCMPLSDGPSNVPKRLGVSTHSSAKPPVVPSAHQKALRKCARS